VSNKTIPTAGFFPFTIIFVVFYFICLMLSLSVDYPALAGFNVVISLGIPLVILVAAEWSRFRPDRKQALAIGIIGVIWWIATAVIVRQGFPWRLWYPLNTLSLLLVTFNAGFWLSGELQKVGDLLAVCILGTVVDIWSVFAGPSRKVAEEVVTQLEIRVQTGEWSPPPILEFALFGYPQPGADYVMPVFGFGDLVFIALFLGGSRRFNLSLFRTFILILIGLFLSLFTANLLSVLGFAKAVPALPFICGVFLLGYWRKLRLEKHEWRVVLLMVAVVIIISAISIFRSRIASE